MELKVVCLVQLMLIGGAFSHSWLACTDYLQENGDYWSAANCRAYARHGHKYSPKDNFGIDTGFDNNNAVESNPCQSGKDDNGAYTTEYPMAIYYTGQKVVLAHPTKNHVAETCTNKYIPDHGNMVYRSGPNPIKDPTLTQFKQNLVADFGVAPFGYTKTQKDITTYPKPGFQNAPKFCENPDKALATNAFYVPNLQPGRYTFMWVWNFNSIQPMDTYTSCWEADVVATPSARDQVLNGRGLTTKDPELLHGISLAKPASGSPAPQRPAPQQPVPQQPTPQPNRGQSNKKPAVQGKQTGSKRPNPIQPVQAVSSRLTCVDSCLSKCYGGA